MTTFIIKRKLYSDSQKKSNAGKTAAVLGTTALAATAVLARKGAGGFRNVAANFKKGGAGFKGLGQNIKSGAEQYYNSAKNMLKRPAAAGSATTSTALVPVSK